MNTHTYFKKKMLASFIKASFATFAICTSAISIAASSDANLRGHAAAGAVITAKQIATGATRRTTADKDGSYALVGLPPGTYQVDAGAGTERTVTLTSPARPGQEARVVTFAPGDPTRIVLELKGGMGRSLTPDPDTMPAVGEQLRYSSVTDGYQPVAAFPAREDTPWTHGGPPPVYEPSDDDAHEEWS